MATKAKQDKFAIAMVVLIILAAALLFYSENPFLFSGSNMQSKTGATVSLYVLPHDEAIETGTGMQPEDGAGT